MSKRTNCRLGFTRLYKRRKDYIKISPSGWVNSNFALSHKEREYKVPYSSHSNFREIEQLVASIRPAVLKCIVSLANGIIDHIRGVKYFNQYSWCLRNIKQRGQDLFIDKYVDFDARSDEYRGLQSIDAKQRIEVILGIDFSESHTEKLEDTRAYSVKTFASIDDEDTKFEDGYTREFKKDEPKEKGKNMKIDRMVKKLNKENEKVNKKIKGTTKRPIDQDKLVNNLYSAKAQDVIKSTSSGMYMTGDATKHIQDSTLEQELKKAGFIDRTEKQENQRSRKAEAREEKPELRVRPVTKR